MPKAPTVLLLTRPKVTSEAFLRDLDLGTDMSIKPIIAPLQEIVSSGAPARLNEGDVAIFTSQHAPPRVSAPKGSLAYCVGDSTAEAARSAGFKPISVSGTAKDLIDRILRDRPDSPLVYARGHYISTDLASEIQAAGLTVSSIIVYEQRDATVSEEALATITTAHRLIAPLFSPRSADRLARTLPLGCNPLILAISDKTAEAWNRPAAGIMVSKSPNRSEMLDLTRKALDSDSHS